MKTFTTCSALAILLAGLILCMGCKKKSGETASTGTVPVVLTVEYNNLLIKTIDVTGNVTNNGGSDLTKRGFCWSSTNLNPTILNDTMISQGNGAASFTSSIKNLTGQTTYYIRAFASNDIGTGYGNTLTFRTIDTTITDIDNNHYRIVQIGSQIWMAENLRTIRYNNGSAIPLVTDVIEWMSITTPGFCWYNNDAATYYTYGALYNWYTVNTGNLAPDGWHVPTDAEWTTLTNYIGGESVAGGKLKEKGTTHWNWPNSLATNETGFTGLPGGYRIKEGLFGELQSSGYWWSSTAIIPNVAWFRSLNYNFSYILISNYDENYGLSVRCVRD